MSIRIVWFLPLLLLLLPLANAEQWTFAYGGSDVDWATSIQQTSDGGYIVAGTTYSFGAGGYDFWIMKLDANGNIPDCPYANNTNATVTSTSVTPQDTSATPGNTSADVNTTNVEPVDTSAEVNLVCLFLPVLPVPPSKVPAVTIPGLLAMAGAIALIGSLILRRR